MDIISLRQHADQYKEIGEASESALAQLMQTHEEYKSNSEAELRKLEVRFLLHRVLRKCWKGKQTQSKALEGRLASMHDEVKRLTEKNSELQQTLESERASFVQDKKTLEETIVEITESQVNAQTDQTSRESEVREQMERVKVSSFVIYLDWFPLTVRCVCLGSRREVCERNRCSCGNYETRR